MRRKGTRLRAAMIALAAAVALTPWITRVDRRREALLWLTAAALLAAAPPELRLERLGAGPDGLELRAHFLGGSGSRAPAGAAPFDTPKAERY